MSTIYNIIGWDEMVTPPTIPITYTKHRAEIFDLPDRQGVLMSHFAREYPDDWEARESDLTDLHIQDRIDTINDRYWAAQEDGEDG